MTSLGSIFASMMDAHRRAQRCAVRVRSHYDREYLRALRRADEQHDSASLRSSDPNAASPGDAPHVTDIRVLIDGADRWRVETRAADGTTHSVEGCDGTRRWILRDGVVRDSYESVGGERRRLPVETVWAANRARTAREVLDPALVLPSIGITSVSGVESRFGPATELTCTPRSTDITESAMVSPLANSVYLDVLTDSGFLVSARNVDEAGSTLVAHDVIELDMSPRFGPADFTPPAR
ncbi:hypothetical protein AB8O38_04620 [Saccharomonospora xinjiangensis]|uniref:hypothetical protein n=1 Tax=Saccharomonospora xinjiangensis TaxID=75294 RepID=UPI00350EE302